jgi:hypothetical protein
MNRLVAVALCASALMAATVDDGRTREAPRPSQAAPNQSIQAVTGSASQSTPLFKIGGMTVHIWAPVEPTYNANANRNLSGDALWESGMPTGRGG